MFLREYVRAAGALTILLTAAPWARADPVAITYTITVEERCTAAECSPFTARFPLVMRFDPGLTFEEVTETSRTVRYGAPVFSAVPFDRPPVIDGAAEFRFTIDLSFLLGAPELPPWRRVAEAAHSYQVLTEEFDYRWNLILSAAADTASRAELSAESFSRFLAQGPDDGDPNRAGSFAFGFAQIDRATGQWTGGSFSLLGHATLADEPAPVPEPATFTLLGAGLAAGAWYRRRRR